MGAEIFSTVIAVSIILFLLTATIVVAIVNYNRKQQMYQQEKKILREEYEQLLLKSQIEVQELTYRHVAKELHDNVGQLMSTTKMLLGITELNTPNPSHTLIAANNTMQKAILELRLLSRSLDGDWISQFDFSENLSVESKRINSGGKITMTINNDDITSLEVSKQIILFRIVQEAVQNAIKHANPSLINVNVERRDSLKVIIENNGEKLPLQIDGMGVRNMMNRAKVLGGKISWSTVNGLTRVEVDLGNT